MASLILENASVQFLVYSGSSRSLKKTVVRMGTGGRISRDAGNRIIVQALQDVSVEIYDGDRVGLLGHNGSGKTTLLRVMAEIYEPTSGSVTRNGKVTPLFDPSLGMDLDATGYDNIRLRGLFLGLSGKQIREKTEEIIDFTELGEFIAVPVRNYSSGMMMRLAFGISTCVLPEILLMDEWMSTGDRHFLQKAEQRMTDFVDSASLMVLASHSEDFIARTCNKALLLEHGQVVAFGEPSEVIALYKERAN